MYIFITIWAVLSVILIILLFNRRPHKCEIGEYEEEVKCDECKHKIDKKDAQEVEEPTGHFVTSVGCDGIIGENYFKVKWVRDTKFFCPMHKKPYDALRYETSAKGNEKLIFLKRIPRQIIEEHYVQVTEQGKEIKEK